MAMRHNVYLYPRRPPFPGAGRPPGPNPRVRHKSRPPLEGDLPGLVVLKVRPRLDLRKPVVVRALGALFEAHGEREGFRVLRHRILTDQVRLLVHFENPAALGRGMKSVAARVARTVNRALARSGAVLKDRYELRVLKTRRDVARALTAKDPRPAARRRSGPGAAKRA